MKFSATMKRCLLINVALGLMFGLPCFFLTGCGDSTKPEDVKAKQESCQHEWSDAASGDVRCKKCGLYKKQAQ